MRRAECLDELSDHLDRVLLNVLEHDGGICGVGRLQRDLCVPPRVADAVGMSLSGVRKRLRSLRAGVTALAEVA